MKKTIFAFAVLLLSFGTQTAHSQYLFSVNDLKNMCLQNVDEFEAFVFSKKYHADPSASSAKVKVYVAEQKTAAAKSYAVSWMKSKKGGQVLCTTSNSGWYNNIKANVLTAANGWVLVKQKNKSINGLPTVVYHYQNSEFHILVYSVGSGKAGEPAQYTIEGYISN